jgi:transcriptional repressor NrdR
VSLLPRSREQVIDSRVTKTTVRSGACASLKRERRFTTYERVEEMPPPIVKKDGAASRTTDEDRRWPEEGLREAAGERDRDRARRRSGRAPDPGTWRKEVELGGRRGGHKSELHKLDVVAYVRFGGVSVVSGRRRVMRELQDLGQEGQRRAAAGAARHHTGGGAPTPTV